MNMPLVFNTLLCCICCFPSQNVSKLGEGLLKQPEDVCFDEEGTLYTATRDGWIKRLRRNGNWENWKHIDSHALLGITAAKDGGLIVCDANKVNMNSSIAQAKTTKAPKSMSYSMCLSHSFGNLSSQIQFYSKTFVF